MFLEDIRIVVGSPPSTHAASNADLRSASTKVPAVPSVGAATTPAAKPGVVAVDAAVDLMLLPAIHYSKPADVRAVPAPPADDAWLRTKANSMSRLSSLPAFIN